MGPSLSEFVDDGLHEFLVGSVDWMNIHEKA